MAATATYNGKTYRLAFLGETKYGRRAKLQFFDGSREFWVDADKVDVRDSKTCETCGHTERRDRRGYLVGDWVRNGECQSCREERQMGY